MKKYTLYDIGYDGYEEEEIKSILGVYDSKEEAENAQRKLEEAFSNGTFGRYARCNLRIEQTH